MKEEGIQTSVHYPACHLFTLFRKEQGTKIGLCPVAEDIANKELTLPLHPQMIQDDVHLVCELLEEALKEEV